MFTGGGEGPGGIGGRGGDAGGEAGRGGVTFLGFGAFLVVFLVSLTFAFTTDSAALMAAFAADSAVFALAFAAPTSVTAFFLQALRAAFAFAVAAAAVALATLALAVLFATSALTFCVRAINRERASLIPIYTSTTNFFQMQGMNEILKTQMLLSMSTVGSPLLGIFAINVFDIANRTFPAWSTWTHAICCSRRPKKAAPKAAQSTITCERGAIGGQPGRPAQQQTVYQTRMDAVVHFVTTLPAMDSLLAVTHHDYLPNEFEPIQIESDVFFELLDLQVVDGQPSIVKFKLVSYEHDVQHLQLFIDTCTANYERTLANKLGNSRYFFDQVIQSKIKGSTQNNLPNSHLIYTKTKFSTNRNFQNVFFEDRKHVQGRTRFFLEHRDWYDKKGIPYTLGFLFHGPPGTGKTSTIKAIANEGRRHIINVQLNEIKTKAQLQHLFFNDEIHVYNGANTEKYIIPVSERLYVIEDIDAMGDTVLRREWKKPTPVAAKPKSEEDAWLDRQKESEQEKLDLSFLLNLLDGTLEASGRILIVTTNFPERLDRALVRPGRVDMIVNFKNASRAVLQEMVDAFYDREFPLPEDESLEGKWTPAEINQILFRNFETPETAVAELVSLSRQDLYGFQENGSESSITEIPTLE